MNAAKNLITASVLLALGVSTGVYAAPKEEDSAYQWGRWAVLSPAAGGQDPYVAVNTPGADFNARPGDASEFEPKIEPGPPVPPPPTVTDDPRDRLPPRPTIPQLPPQPN
jgi:hypothetical protein